MSRSGWGERPRGGIAGTWARGVLLRLADRRRKGPDRFSPRTVRALALTATSPSTPPATARVAARALEQWIDEPAFLRLVLAGVRDSSRTVTLKKRAGGPVRYLSGRPYLVTPAAADLLFAPVTDSPYVPAVRLVAYLGGEEPRGRHWSQTTHKDIANWLVQALRDASPKTAEHRLTRLLATTDEPNLLKALRDAFVAAVRGGNGPEHRHLETEGTPTRLAEALSSNPHLLDSPELHSEPEQPTAHGHHEITATVLLTVLQNRTDLLEACSRAYGPVITLDTLLTGTELVHHTVLRSGCHQALREISTGTLLENLCARAEAGHGTARAAITDTGHLPVTRNTAVFLFRTRQWERYDAIDPDGTILKRYCAERMAAFKASSAPDHLGMIQELRSIQATARQAGRPDPCPPFPEPPPPPKRPPTNPYSGGSWPTNPGGHFGGFGHF